LISLKLSGLEAPDFGLAPSDVVVTTLAHRARRELTGKLAPLGDAADHGQSDGSVAETPFFIRATARH
jgi:hypothetical protein